MVLTPTYHVFEMYKVHQDATLLPTHVECPEYVASHETTPNPAQAGIPMPWDAVQQISASASRDESGRIHVSLCNLHHDEPTELACELRGATATRVSGRILTGPATNTHNTFEQPDLVKPASFEGVKVAKGGLNVSLPPRSVVVLEIQ
jgi:alpha-N-arabinofuranosidase